MADIHAAALAEDPSIFDYDAHYDDIQASRAEPKRQEKVARHSKYIASLLGAHLYLGLGGGGMRAGRGRVRELVGGWWVGLERRAT